MNFTRKFMLLPAAEIGAEAWPKEYRRVRSPSSFPSQPAAPANHRAPDRQCDERDLKQSLVLKITVGAGVTIGTNGVAKDARRTATPCSDAYRPGHRARALCKLPFDRVGDFAASGCHRVPMIWCGAAELPAKT